MILLLVVPWFSWQTHPHWDRVQWTLFLAPVKTRDIVANVLLYLPFGYWANRQWPSNVWRVVGLAFALSLATEVTQVYSHGRFPSVRDVVCNAFGGWLGTGIVAWGRWGREPNRSVPG